MNTKTNTITQEPLAEYAIEENANIQPVTIDLNLHKNRGYDLTTIAVKMIKDHFPKPTHRRLIAAFNNDENHVCFERRLRHLRAHFPHMTIIEWTEDYTNEWVEESIDTSTMTKEDITDLARYKGFYDEDDVLTEEFDPQSYC